ncbi:hypothetical protein SAMN04487919_1548 [Bacillus sp. ok061]|uniref:hypothetical protein n=1 Tax=Bacillus sp. ok061 TaxID=1761766 RepID=UPI00089F1EF8|nr:hypothetical protein [Bacillus sp. ok061]SEG87676.1 hypothetical protein SAMN04487919_1548 [Bacillus sp. ok061]
MSQANIPNITPNISLTREESINLILASIALEELGLAHIINAEAEKIQYVLGTLSGLSPAATLDEILEVNETPEECFKREAMEEGYVEGKCNLLGYIIVDHNENPKWDEKSKYPKIGYQVFYRMDIKEFRAFEGKHESAHRKLINPNEITVHHHEWHSVYQSILDYALYTEV